MGKRLGNEPGGSGRSPSGSNLRSSRTGTAPVPSTAPSPPLAAPYACSRERLRCPDTTPVSALDKTPSRPTPPPAPPPPPPPPTPPSILILILLLALIPRHSSSSSRSSSMLGGGGPRGGGLVLGGALSAVFLPGGKPFGGTRPAGRFEPSSGATFCLAHARAPMGP